MQNLSQRFPAVADLAARAKRRIPHFAWEFLVSGTGADVCAKRNRSALESVTLAPRFLRGEFVPDPSVSLFGQHYTAPFGVSAVGMSGLIWPETDLTLARMAASRRLPFCLSTAGNFTPETIGPLTDGMGWFQLYPPRQDRVRRDLLARVRDSGFTTLVLTVDVPAMSRRERQVRAGVSSIISPAVIAQSLVRPAWAIATVRARKPRLRVLEKYVPPDDMNQFLTFVGEELNGTLDWKYLQQVRDEWDGPLVLKGILDIADAERAVSIGVDGIQVSNHGGRQLDAAPAAASVLPAIAQAVNGRAKVLFDSGIRSGLDVARTLALGADFVFLGRTFMFGMGALGAPGGDYAATLVRDDLTNAMSQLGCRTIAELRERI